MAVLLFLEDDVPQVAATAGHLARLAGVGLALTAHFIDEGLQISSSLTPGAGTCNVLPLTPLGI